MWFRLTFEALSINTTTFWITNVLVVSNAYSNMCQPQRFMASCSTHQTDRNPCQLKHIIHDCTVMWPRDLYTSITSMRMILRYWWGHIYVQHCAIVLDYLVILRHHTKGGPNCTICISTLAYIHRGSTSQRPLLHTKSIFTSYGVYEYVLVGGFNPSEQILGLLFPIYGKSSKPPSSV